MTDPLRTATEDLPPSGPVSMIRLAAAMAIQDAAAHMRNTHAIANAAIGVAQQMMLRGENVAAAQEALTAAQNAVTAASLNFASVSNAAGDILDRFAVEASKPSSEASGD